jgi:hypothetical protein
MKINSIVAVLLVAFILTSCAPATPATEVAPIKTIVPSSTSMFTSLPPTIEPVQRLATPTEFQLPFNDKNVESEYCQLPSVKLPTSDAQGLSDDEIAVKLMDLHLAYFNAPQAPDWCRVDGYKIDKIYYDERTPSLPLVPKSDIMRVVQYSIKLIQIPNMWMSLAGEVDQQNWLHIRADVAIFHLPDGYIMKFAYP